MGLSPLMQSLYEYHAALASGQQAQMQNQQAQEEQARQAYRDAFQQHYQEELLKLQQGKAQQESAQQALMNPLEVEKAKADIGLTKARTESENKPDDINGKAVSMFTTLLSSGQASTPAQAEEAVKSFYPDWKGLTPGYKSATANAAVQAGRISPTQVIQPQFSPVGGTQGPEQPTPFGQFAMPQAPATPGVSPVQTGAPLEVQRPQEDLINQAMGLLSPAASAALDLKAAQAHANEARAQEAQSTIARNEATIKNINSQIRMRDWRQQYTPQRDAAKDKLAELKQKAAHNQWLQGFMLAKDKFEWSKQHAQTVQNSKQFQQALSIGQATGAAIQRYISPLNTEWQRANTYLDRLQSAQRTIHENLQQPMPDPKDPKYSGNPVAYANDVKQRQQWEAQNRALYGTNGQDGLIGQVQHRMTSLKQEMDPYKAELMSLPNTIIQGVKPPLIKSGNAPQNTPKPSTKATVDAIAKDLGF